MEPEADQSAGLMKIKVKTLGNTVYDLEMKPEVTCSAPHAFRRQISSSALWQSVAYDA